MGAFTPAASPAEQTMLMFSFVFFPFLSKSRVLIFLPLYMSVEVFLYFSFPTVIQNIIFLFLIFWISSFATGGIGNTSPLICGGTDFAHLSILHFPGLKSY